MRTYRDVFGVAEFRILFLARCATMAAVSIESIALATVTYSATGSPLLTSLSLFGGPLITLIGSATVLGASDALPPRRASLVMPAAYVVACLLQAIPGLPWGARFAILAIPYLAGSATSGSNVRLLHLVLPPDGFILGRATMNLAVGGMQIAGYALGGLLLLTLSTTGLFLVAAVLVVIVCLLIRFGIRERPGVRSEEGLVRRTGTVNRRLLTSPVTLPVYIAMCVPNGLVVGCEALFVPLAHDEGSPAAAGLLFAAAAAGMLLGDVLMGRVIPPAARDRLIEPLRLLLAVPYVALVFGPPLPVVMALGFVASVGYSASLPLQERLVGATDDTIRGQAFGLYSTGLMLFQAVGAGIGGLVAEFLPTHDTMAVLAAVSVAISLALTVPLRRSAPVPLR